MRSPVIAVYILIGLTALTGFIREAAIAASFGFGQETDAFFFAFGLVQTAHDLVFSGSLSASVIPLLKPMAIATGNTQETRARFVTTLTMIVLGTGLVLAGILSLFFPAIVRFLAPDMTGTTLTETVFYGRIMAWLLPANAMMTLFSLILNAHDRFRAAAAIYLGGNIVFITTIVGLGRLIGPAALPVAGLAGPLIFGPWLGIRLWRSGLLQRIKPDFSRSFFASVMKLAGPPLLSLGIGSSVGLLMASHMILRGFAAAFGQGGISATGYAFRLYEAPISIIVNPVATLIFPAVAAFVATRSLEKFALTCRQVLTWGLIVMLPVAVATYAGAEIVVTLLLQRGSFDAAAVQLTSEALRGFAPAVLFEGVFVVFFRIFYALHKPGIPVAVGIVTLAALESLLHLTGGTSLFGLTLTLSLAFGLAALFLLIGLRRSIGPGSLPTLHETGRLAIVAIASSIPAMALDYALGEGLWWRFVSLTVFFIGYTLGIVLLLPERRKEALSAIVHRIRRSPSTGTAI